MTLILSMSFKEFGKARRSNMMKEGFYFYKNNLYYGIYDEEQVSGGASIEKIKPEWVKTNHPIGEEKWAVRLRSNHRLLEPEYEGLQAMLLQMQTFMRLNKDQKVDFSEVEKRLNVELPKELKQIYGAIYKLEEYFNSEEHFLPIDELYVEQGILVFCKKKRTAIAGYDLESGRLARYYKKEWDVDEGDVCCYQFAVGRMITIAMENKPVFKKGRCKGAFVKTLNIERELQKYCTVEYRLLAEFNVYGIAVMYSTDGVIAWIRSNGLYADIHAGAEGDAHLEALGEHLGEMVWK